MQIPISNLNLAVSNLESCKNPYSNVKFPKFLGDLLQILQAKIYLPVKDWKLDNVPQKESWKSWELSTQGPWNSIFRGKSSERWAPKLSLRKWEMTTLLKRRKFSTYMKIKIITVKEKTLEMWPKKNNYLFLWVDKVINLNDSMSGITKPATWGLNAPRNCFIACLYFISSYRQYFRKWEPHPKKLNRMPNTSLLRYQTPVFMEVTSHLHLLFLWLL